MIISKTPFRVSLFGGGTDYPAWYSEHEGDCLGFAIDKYCWLTLRRLPPFFPYRHRIVYSDIELVKSIDELRHPAVREIMRGYFTGTGGIELHHDGDLPARSGLGSSSSFVVGLINAFSALRGNMLDRRHLATSAIRMEQKTLAENVGCQDQIFATYGGFRRIQIAKDGNFAATPVIMPELRQAEMTRSLMLFFTGISRTASEIAGKQIAGFDKHRYELRTIAELVDEASACFTAERAPLTDIGKLLDTHWSLKRELAEGVSTERVDDIYRAGREAGALGGKLLGAGGGGFILFYVPIDRQEDVRERLKMLVEVKFNIAREGSQIVLYEPGGLQ